MHITFITLSSWWIFFNISTLDPKYSIIVTVNQCVPTQARILDNLFLTKGTKLVVLSLGESSLKTAPKIQRIKCSINSTISLFKHHVHQYHKNTQAGQQQHEITRDNLFFNPGLFTANPTAPSPESRVLSAGQAPPLSPSKAFTFSGQESTNYFHINLISMERRQGSTSSHRFFSW